MTFNSPAKTMFPLSEVHPAWSGQWIAELKPRLLAGIAELDRRCAGRGFLGFVMVSTFDYGDCWDTIRLVEACDNEAAVSAALEHAVKELERELLAENPGWVRRAGTQRNYEVLPATGAILSGAYPTQIGGSKLAPNEAGGNPYQSIYLRQYLIIRSEGGDLVQQLLAFNGLQEAIANYLKRLGDECMGRQH